MQEKPENLVTASEFAEFVYCRRAWLRKPPHAASLTVR